VPYALLLIGVGVVLAYAFSGLIDLLGVILIVAGVCLLLAPLFRRSP
jgi:uncharacterized Tic20 family protein